MIGSVDALVQIREQFETRSRVRRATGHRMEMGCRISCRASPLWLLIVLIVVLPTAVAMGAQVLDPPMGRRREAGQEQRNRRIQIRDRRRHLCGAPGLRGDRRLGKVQRSPERRRRRSRRDGGPLPLYRGRGARGRRRAERRSPTTSRAAIDNDWPAMARESESHDGHAGSRRLYTRPRSRSIELPTRGTADMSEVFRQIDNVTAARRSQAASGDRPRARMSSGWLSSWARVLTVGFTLFFGSENPTRAGLNDRRAVGSRHHGSGRHPLDRPSLHRPGLHPSRRRWTRCWRNSADRRADSCSAWSAASGSPPKPGRRQFHQRFVRVTDIEARSTTRPAIFANNLDAAFGEPLAPGVEIP